jgi:hypothetical protein
LAVETIKQNTDETKVPVFECNIAEEQFKCIHISGSLIQVAGCLPSRKLKDLSSNTSTRRKKKKVST